MVTELTNEEWFYLFRNDYDQLLKIIEIESKNEPRACWKCFRNHSIAAGCADEIPSYWEAL